MAEQPTKTFTEFAVAALRQTPVKQAFYTLHEDRSTLVDHPTDAYCVVGALVHEIGVADAVIDRWDELDTDIAMQRISACFARRGYKVSVDQLFMLTRYNDESDSFNEIADMLEKREK